MKRTIIWGTESTGIEICTKVLSHTYSFDTLKREILFFVDTNSKKWGKSLKVLVNNQDFCFFIQNPNTILEVEFDEVIIASVTGYKEILGEIQQKIPSNKINIDYCKLTQDARINFLENFAKDPKWHNPLYSVAELGVFQGEFAKEINKNFPNNKLYLFDTFEGFDSRDLKSEETRIQQLGSHLSNTSIDLVMSKMFYSNNVVIKAGWFPQSCYSEGGGGDDMTKQRFCFVNIDTDLHDSVLAGLEFFYPKMEKGGVILIHDYFSFFYTGVKKAVNYFCKTNNATKIPIGDVLSIAIIKE